MAALPARSGSDSNHKRRIGISELEHRLGVDRSTVWRWCRRAVSPFPAPHYLGLRRCWFEHEIEAWEAERMSRPVEAHGPVRTAKVTVAP